MAPLDLSEIRAEAAPPPRLRLSRAGREAVVTANASLEAQGAVSDGRLYATRGQARWPAEWLMGALMRMGVRERWEIRQRTWADAGGYRWAVEHVATGQQLDAGRTA